jgi:hypothetical protein
MLRRPKHSKNEVVAAKEEEEKEEEDYVISVSIEHPAGRVIY